MQTPQLVTTRITRVYFPKHTKISATHSGQCSICLTR